MKRILCLAVTYAVISLSAFAQTNSAAIKHKEQSKKKHRDLTYVELDGGIIKYDVTSSTIQGPAPAYSGSNFNVGVNTVLPISKRWNIIPAVKLNNTTARRSGSWTDQSTGEIINDHSTFRFITFSIGADAALKLHKGYSFFFGLQAGFILSAKNEYYGEDIMGSVVTPIGKRGFSDINETKNVQIGANIGVAKCFIAGRSLLKPFINIYEPFTDMLKLTNINNKMYLFNIGLAFSWGSARAGFTDIEGLGTEQEAVDYRAKQ